MGPSCKVDYKFHGYLIASTERETPYEIGRKTCEKEEKRWRLGTFWRLKHRTCWYKSTKNRHQRRTVKGRTCLKGLLQLRWEMVLPSEHHWLLTGFWPKQEEWGPSQTSLKGSRPLQVECQTSWPLWRPVHEVYERNSLWTWCRAIERSATGHRQNQRGACRCTQKELGWNDS